MNRRFLITLSVLLLSCVSAGAEDLVYESSSGITIGRVFLSQEQREQLDVRRLISPQGGEAGTYTSSATKPESKSLQSAGYIIGPSGRSKVWKDGDFVGSRSDAASSVSFPGDVKVTRHTAVDEPVTANDDPSQRDSGPASDEKQK